MAPAFGRGLPAECPHQPRRRSHHKADPEQRRRAERVAKKCRVERHREHDLHQPHQRHLGGRPGAERPRQAHLPRRRRRADPEQHHERQPSRWEDFGVPAREQEEAREAGDRRHGGKVDHDRPRVDAPDVVQPEHGKCRRKRGDEGGGGAEVPLGEVRLLHQGHSGEATCQRQPQRRRRPLAHERPRQERHPHREQVRDRQDVRLWHPRQGVERADEAQAAGEAADPEDAGPQHHQPGPRQTAQEHGEDEGKEAAAERDQLPVAGYAEPVGQGAHSGERDAAAEHPEVGGQGGGPNGRCSFRIGHYTARASYYPFRRRFQVHPPAVPPLLLKPGGPARAACSPDILPFYAATRTVQPAEGHFAATFSNTDFAACSVPLRSLLASTTIGCSVGFTHGSA